ncbi:MAG TPA: hypothetical protein VKG63_07420 [Steroidobacteraceae bacterium]|nr:hypothetical protein [Steroidobacteraceae bacterium]
MNVVIHIDRVIFRGLPLPASQLPAVRAALERELHALFRTAGAGGNVRAGSTERHLAKPFEYRAEQGPARLGRQAAGAVHAATRGRVSR